MGKQLKKGSGLISGCYFFCIFHGMGKYVLFWRAKRAKKKTP
jgi:hypothetical protein